MFKVKNLDIRNPVVIAPMAGISNAAFRQLAFENGAGLVYTEMVSDKAIFYNNKKTINMAEVDNSFHPVSLQIFGSSVETMVYAAKYVDEKTNADIVDINMGCPVNKVVKTGAGSALLLNPKKAIEIAKEVVKSCKKPVSVKMRVGYYNDGFDYLDFAQKLEATGISLLAVHGRTRSQMYEGKADWSKIKTIKEHLKIPVIGNGDIKTVDDFIRCKDYSKVDGVMIGRGVVGNPFLIKEINNYLAGKNNYEVIYQERFDMCLKHFEKLIALYGEKLATSQMRGLAPHYLTGLVQSAMYRGKCNSISSYDDLKMILDEYTLFLQNDCQVHNNVL